MAEVRKPEELQDAKYNYFIAFGISPSETDVAKL